MTLEGTVSLLDRYPNGRNNTNVDTTGVGISDTAGRIKIGSIGNYDTKLEVTNISIILGCLPTPVASARINRNRSRTIKGSD